MDEKNRSTRSGGPKVCCCAGEYRARIMACSVIFHAITIGYRRKGKGDHWGELMVETSLSRSVIW